MNRNAVPTFVESQQQAADEREARRDRWRDRLWFAVIVGPAAVLVAVAVAVAGGVR